MHDRASRWKRFTASFWQRAPELSCGGAVAVRCSARYPVPAAGGSRGAEVSLQRGAATLAARRAPASPCLGPLLYTALMGLPAGWAE